MRWEQVRPTPEEIGALSPFERFAFRLTRRMNSGRWKQFWTFCQRHLGAGWIHLATYNLMRVYGVEYVERAVGERPLLLVANHRSFFDMYVVSATLFRRTRAPVRLFFPVRGRFFYDSPAGLLVNLLMGWWSMFPPFFASAERPQVEKRSFDKYSLRLLAALCREGTGNVVGFHPEGTRNKSDDPYSFLRAQPGVGKLIREARPQVIPVFIAGLGNDLLRQVLGNWRGGEPVRIHFGPPIDFSAFDARGESVRVYKEMADLAMTRIAELGEQDRSMYQLSAGQQQPTSSPARVQSR